MTFWKRISCRLSAPLAMMSTSRATISMQMMQPAPSQRAVQAEKLAFLTDVEGVYKDFEDKDSLISEMEVDEAQAFVDSGSLGGGMLPKLQNCIDAIKTAFPEFIFWMDGFHTACCLKSLQIRVSELPSIIQKRMRGITMADEKMINRAEQVLYKTYNRFPVVFDHGKE